MSDYAKITDFAAKDALAPGNPAKIITGTAHDNEFNAISVAIATKANSASPTFTGTITAAAATFSGNVSVAGTLTGVAGTFSGAVSGTTGTFSGAVSGTSGTFSSTLSVTGAATFASTGTFSGVLSAAANGQTTYANAGLQCLSGTGDVHVTWHAVGTSACSLKHTRASNGLSLVSTDGTTLTDFRCGPLSVTGAVTASSNIVTTAGGIYAYGWGGNNDTGVLFMNSGATKYIHQTGSAFAFVGVGINAPGVTSTAGVAVGGALTGATTGAFSGAVTASDFTISSDARVKYDVRVLRNAGAIVDTLTGYSFRYKDSHKKSIGFIAQEVQQVLPELVHEKEDGTLAVAYGQVAALLLEEVKSLRLRVAALEAR